MAALLSLSLLFTTLVTFGPTPVQLSANFRLDRAVGSREDPGEAAPRRGDLPDLEYRKLAREVIHKSFNTTYPALDRCESFNMTITLM